MGRRKRQPQLPDCWVAATAKAVTEVTWLQRRGGCIGLEREEWDVHFFSLRTEGHMCPHHALNRTGHVSELQHVSHSPAGDGGDGAHWRLSKPKWSGCQRAGAASRLVGPIALSPDQDSLLWWDHIIGQAAHLMAKKKIVNEKGWGPTITFKGRLTVT